MPFKSITKAQHEAFLLSVRSGQYNLLLGAGTSLDTSNPIGPIPSGTELRHNLCDFKKVSRNYTLQRAFGLLTPSEIDEQVTHRLIHCKPGKTSTALSGFLWKRIFTWNIDDVLENTYKAQTVRQEVKSIHYNDEFVEFQTLAELMIVHMQCSASL